MIILLALLVGCTPKAPPALFSSPPAPVDPPELKELKGAQPEDAPASVVVKVPSKAPTSRASGARGAYATEVFFYRDLAPDGRETGA